MDKNSVSSDTQNEDVTNHTEGDGGVGGAFYMIIKSLIISFTIFSILLVRLVSSLNAMGG